MISFIFGRIEEKYENKVVVECNGIGYEIFVSANTLTSLPIVGEQCKIYTYMQVREDGVTLFGFSTHDERELFNNLISVSGVGPKMAIGILSGMKISDLIVCILKQDVNSLSKIKGLGKKTAERIVLELKDKISQSGEIALDDSFEAVNEDVINDACEVLIALGINKNEALRLSKQHASKNATTEDIISAVLRNMGR